MSRILQPGGVGRERGTATYPGFSPGMLGPQAWWRADSLVSLSGSNVTSWGDLTGNGWTLASAGAPPAWSATGWNSSRPAVTFTGSQFLRSLAAGLGDYPVGTNRDFSVLCVSSAPAGALAMPLEWSDTGVTELFSLRSSDASSHMEFSIPFGPGTATGADDSSGRHVYGWVYQGGLATGYLDNNTEFSAVSMPWTFSSLSRLFVGNAWNVSAPAGPVAELIFVPNALTITDFSNFRTYAKALWGGLP